MITLIIMFVIYFSPTIIAAYKRHKRQEAIGIINIFLGWTFIGWVIALAWAVSGDENGQDT